MNLAGTALAGSVKPRRALGEQTGTVVVVVAVVFYDKTTATEIQTPSRI